MENPLNNKYPVWVEISRKNLLHNISEIKKLVKTVSENIKISAVVKSNAYGHGMLETAAAVDSEIDWYCVNALWEAEELINKNNVIKPVLVMGYTPLENLETAAELHNVRLTVYNMETLEKLNEIAEKKSLTVSVHIKLETGTGRQGIMPEEIENFALFFSNSTNVILEGISTHFANIEDTTDHSYYKYQLKNFKDMVSEFEKRGIEIPVKHTACTAACILFPDTYFNLIRPGIGMYGLWPSKETFLSCLIDNKDKIKLKPAMTFKTMIAQIKHLPEDSFVGYGCSYKTTHKTRLAILPVGYYDGYDRLLSNKSYVIIRGKRAPIVGRICMNICMADITHINDAQIEDEVILIGSSENETVSAETLAGLCGTINYEIVTRINQKLPRIVTE
jgi:alanine racemase